MEPSNQTPPSQAPVVAPIASPEKKSNVWLWVIGGCLGIIILGMLVAGGLTWWAAHKIKEKVNEAKPQFEQWQKDAEKMQKDAEQWQQEFEKSQQNLPSLSQDETESADN